MGRGGGRGAAAPGRRRTRPRRDRADGSCRRRVRPPRTPQPLEPPRGDRGGAPLRRGTRRHPAPGRGLPGRGAPPRLVAEIDGVRYVNDSQGTQPDAVAAALRSFDAPVVLIAGGRDKGVDLSSLGPVAAERASAAVLIGESGAELAALFRAAGVPSSRRPARWPPPSRGPRRSRASCWTARRPGRSPPCSCRPPRRASTSSPTTRPAAAPSRTALRRSPRPGRRPPRGGDDGSRRPRPPGRRPVAVPSSAGVRGASASPRAPGPPGRGAGRRPGRGRPARAAPAACPTRRPGHGDRARRPRPDGARPLVVYSSSAMAGYLRPTPTRSGPRARSCSGRPLGLVLMFVAMRVDYRWLRLASLPLLLVAGVLLVLVQVDSFQVTVGGSVAVAQAPGPAGDPAERAGEARPRHLPGPLDGPARRRGGRPPDRPAAVRRDRGPVRPAHLQVARHRLGGRPRPDGRRHVLPGGRQPLYLAGLGAAAVAGAASS